MSWVFVAWALVASGFTWVTCWRLSRRSRSTRLPAVSASDSVLIVRPVDAPGPHELEALAVPLVMPGVRQLVVSPVRPQGLPGSTEWLASDPTQCANRKVAHVLAALGAAKPPSVVLCIDADVMVDAALVGSLVSAVHSGSAAASAAPWVERRGGLAERAMCGVLVQSHHSFVALDAMQVGAKALCGKALAMSPAAIDVFGTLGDVVGEDLELAKRLDALGLAVALVDAPARVVRNPRAAFRANVIERFTRWMQVLRAHRPRLFPSVPVLFAATPLLLVSALCFGSTSLWCAVSVLGASRFVLARRLCGAAAPWEWALAELVLLWCWVASLIRGRRLTWRGRRYALSVHGHLQSMSEGRPT